MTTTAAPWSPQSTTAGHSCHVCSFRVFKPIYWNAERQEVYCCARCSLDREEELKKAVSQ